MSYCGPNKGRDIAIAAQESATDRTLGLVAVKLDQML